VGLPPLSLGLTKLFTGRQHMHLTAGFLFGRLTTSTAVYLAPILVIDGR